MSEALIAMVLQNLYSTMYLEAEQEVIQVVGVTKRVQHLASTLQTIQALLADAEKRQVKQQVVKLWLEKLRDISYEIDDVLDDWSTALLKSQIEKTHIGAPPCFCFNRIALRRDIAVKIKELNSKLGLIAREKDDYNLKSVTMIPAGEEELDDGWMQKPKTTSFLCVSEVLGRTRDMQTVVSKLLGLGESSSTEEMGFHKMIVVVGMAHAAWGCWEDYTSSSCPPLFGRRRENWCENMSEGKKEKKREKLGVNVKKKDYELYWFPTTITVSDEREREKKEHAFWVRRKE